MKSEYGLATPFLPLFPIPLVFIITGLAWALTYTFEQSSLRNKDAQYDMDTQSLMQDCSNVNSFIKKCTFGKDTCYIVYDKREEIIDISCLNSIRVRNEAL